MRNSLVRSKWFLLVAAILGFTFLVGCSSGKASSGKAGSEKKDTTAQKAPEKSAEDELAFFKDKTVTLIVPTAAGGGYDAYGRLLQPSLQKYLPGSTVIVKNVPGAGHIIGTNEIYSSKPDGLTFGIFNKGLITGQLAGLEGIKFDLKKMSFIANAASEPRLFAVSVKSPYNNIDDMKMGKAAKPVNMASAGPGSAAYSDAFMIQKIFNLNFKIVAGYDGGAADLAILRGEVDGQIQSFDSSRALLEQKATRPILVVGTKKIPEVPDTPLIGDVAPADQKALASLMANQAQISRPFAGPPGIPEARLKVIRDAFDKSFKDPELLERAKTGKLPIEYMNGVDTQKAFMAALDQPQSVLDVVKTLNEPTK